MQSFFLTSVVRWPLRTKSFSYLLLKLAPVISSKSASHFLSQICSWAPCKAPEHLKKVHTIFKEYFLDVRYNLPWEATKYYNIKWPQKTDGLFKRGDKWLDYPEMWSIKIGFIFTYGRWTSKPVVFQGMFSCSYTRITDDKIDLNSSTDINAVDNHQHCGRQ